MVERVDIDSEDVHWVHDAFSGRCDMARLSAKRAGVEGIWRWEAMTLVAVYYDARTRSRPATSFYIANDVFRIKELVYVNQSSATACGTILRTFR